MLIGPWRRVNTPVGHKRRKDGLRCGPVDLENLATARRSQDSKFVSVDSPPGPIEAGRSAWIIAEARIPHAFCHCGR
jgi:hypothetical protein